MEKSVENFPFLLLFISSLFLSNISCQTDTVTPTQSIKDGDTIVSSDGAFELGFFSPANSFNRYVGIWYTVTDGTPVWVANRQAPLRNKKGALKIIHPGVLVLLDASNRTVWSTNATARPVKTPVAQLLETGNLVVRDSDGETLWQSFDYPTNTLLASMKLGKNLVSGLEMYLSSWKSPDDPAPGEYTYHCDITGYPQDLLRKGSKVVYRAGPWNGLHWSGAPNMVNNTMTSFGLVMNKNEIYYIYELVNKSVISTLVVDPDGDTGRRTWVEKSQYWQNYHSVKADDCDAYGLCGAYGTCNILDAPVCQCFVNFVPKNQEDWERADWSGGCVREADLNCSGDGFLKYTGVKLPDTNISWYNETMSIDECKDVCAKNCSCMAYTSLDIRNGGSGCLLWIGDLVDTRQLSENGQDIYIRMAYSVLASAWGSTGRRRRREIFTVGLPLMIAAVLIVLVIGTMFYLRKTKKKNIQETTSNGFPDHTSKNDSTGVRHTEDLELPQFDLFTINQATDNFSINSKIGEGGFGPVYKGVLEGGQEIAVKRLSETSNQGLGEFKNEVICIAKLQHRNLVKLLGCCIEGEETMLVYEYMPYKSLDLFIFDEERSGLLDWPKRFNIINGIARGLLYLHQDSRLRIIHRDLKASNILLDIDMNPKISDFGLARSFGGNETGANTRRVVGTYGYMSPEYAVDGIFSVKSDVFSFGVLVLEIISGKKNRRFVHPDHQLNLLGHVWTLYKENRSLELVNPILIDSCDSSEVTRSIHVGLLCVQQSPEDRPNMSSVVWMLSNEGVLPEAKLPGFFTERSVPSIEGYSWSTQTPSSVNDVTISLLDAR